jgi:hypothetical protein
MTEGGPARSRARDLTLYRVIVADNYHYQDPDEEYVQGDYASKEEAVAVCKKIVDECLAEHMEPGATAASVFRGYTMFGDDPFILTPRGAPMVKFSGWDYAKVRSVELTEAI